MISWQKTSGMSMWLQSQTPKPLLGELQCYLCCLTKHLSFTKQGEQKSQTPDENLSHLNPLNTYWFEACGCFLINIYRNNPILLKCYMHQCLDSPCLQEKCIKMQKHSSLCSILSCMSLWVKVCKCLASLVILHTFPVIQGRAHWDVIL